MTVDNWVYNIMVYSLFNFQLFEFTCTIMEFVDHTEMISERKNMKIVKNMKNMKIVGKSNPKFDEYFQLTSDRENEVI